MAASGPLAEIRRSVTHQRRSRTQDLAGLGLPLGTADVVAFERVELDRLVTLMFSTTIFGCSVAQDLYVIPDRLGG